MAQNDEIIKQNEEIHAQAKTIKEQSEEIHDSINYARRIQRSLLTPSKTIATIFPDYFILYKPRNVVSGDYYWVGQFGDNKVSIVADCTGHGVPGGFMSMLGMTNLNYIVGQELRPDEILNKLRNAIITSLRQKDDSIQPTGDEKADRRAAFAMATEKKDRSQDGMDVAMYVINEKEMTLSFAGANNPLVLIRDGEVQVIKASKMPVGILLAMLGNAQAENRRIQRYEIQLGGGLSNFEMVRGLLETAGLEPVVMNTQDSSYLFGDVHVYVSPEQVEQAETIIKSIDNE